jgi:hypothetical protein
LGEDVVVELFKGESSVGIIDTTASTGAYKWDIDFSLATGPDYTIKIYSRNDDKLYDVSDASFSVIDTITNSIDNDLIEVNSYNLYQNYPNPFNPSTRIKFTLLKSEEVTLAVYNILGQVVKLLVNQNMDAGHHEVEFNAQELSSGIYYYRIEAGEFQDVKKMVFLQ